MYEDEIRAALRNLPLSGLRVLGSTTSTNDLALAWAADDGPDLGVVVADEQRSGRGRAGRKWHTPKGTALAVSVILRPEHLGRSGASRLAGLGALAVAEAADHWGLHAEIKWPNDIVLGGRKFSGVLVESTWMGTTLEACVIGIGVNVLRGAVPEAGELAYPGTSLEAELGRAIDRGELLQRLLLRLVAWRERLETDEFLRCWEDRLAFKGALVNLIRQNHKILTGTILGLEDDGSLRLQVMNQVVRVPSGEIQLRLSGDRIG